MWKREREDCSLRQQDQQRGVLKQGRAVSTVAQFHYYSTLLSSLSYLIETNHLLFIERPKVDNICETGMEILEGWKGLGVVETLNKRIL